MDFSFTRVTPVCRIYVHCPSSVSNDVIGADDNKLIALTFSGVASPDLWPSGTSFQRKDIGLITY